MASPMVFFLLFSSLSSIAYSQSKLSPDYYAQSCPRLEQIINDITNAKQHTNPVTAGATLRIYFHDCMVEGCDASVLLSSTPNNTAERDHEMNLSLAGDGFDVVVKAKEALEQACPGVVSCSDILALTTRSLLKIIGAPHYKLNLGRKDGLVSQASRVEGNLAKTDMKMDEIIKLFEAKGFNIEEMTVLTGGGHTIGLADCKEVYHRVFNFSGIPNNADPGIHPLMADLLRKACDNYQSRPGASAMLDPMTPVRFDNKYFFNLRRGINVLASDQLFETDPRTKPLVTKFDENEGAFMEAFARVMEKLSEVGVKTGNEGEVRKRCDVINGAAKV